MHFYWISKITVVSTIEVENYNILFVVPLRWVTKQENEKDGVTRLKIPYKNKT